MDDLFSPRGMALVNAIACAIFVVLIGLSLARQRIHLGSMTPKVIKSDNPRVFWALIGLYAVIVLWTGIAATRSLS